MNMDEQLKSMKQEYLNMNIPEEVMEKMKQSIDQAKMEKRRQIRNRRIRRAGMGVAAALVIAVALPNMSADIAYAMEKIPVIGGFFRVVTFRSYEYEDENYSAQVEIPQVSVESQEGGAADDKLQDTVSKINLDIEKVTQDLISQFEQTVQELDGQGHVGLEISNEVVTDNDQWFTLKLSVLEVQATGYQHEKYYTVDKRTGEVVALGGLFAEGSDYVTVLSDNIKEQMRSRMQADEGAMYFLNSEVPESDFQQIREDVNFYFNKDGNLTIVFDEYEVAPGYMGVQEFVIPGEVTGSILK